MDNSSANQSSVNQDSSNTGYSLRIPLVASILILILLLSVLSFTSSNAVLKGKQEFDRRNLYQFFEEGSYDNDLLLDTFLIPASSDHEQLFNLHLLNLQRDRLAYIAKDGDGVVAIAVPATADDGFNGHVELLVAITMFGRISAARVIDDLNSNELYGVVDVIQSQWMKQFTGNTMRDILGTSWKKVSADNEYDQFVGASVTPKTVSQQIYDTLVFFQSNRIALMAGESGGI